MMSVFKILICSFLFLSSFANDLIFTKNDKVVVKIKLQDLKSGRLKIGDNYIGSLDKTLFNAWRAYERTYRGYNFFELLDAVYGADWKKAKTINFKATDGYKQIANIKRMLDSSKGKQGYISYTETGKDGFTFYKRKEKIIDPGPIYLVWSNFSGEDKASHGDNLKWPYMLETINIKE